jgi:Domain of unknown function (DUF4124)
MKVCIVLTGLMLWATPLLAETYTWVDEDGTYNFTEDYSRVPLKYRKSVGRRGDMEGQPAVPHAEAPDAKAPVVTPQKGKENQVQGVEDSGLYGGKKPEAWQQEMRPLYGEVKRLEQQLDELQSLIKKPAGISKSRFDGLPQEFRETQKQYMEQLKRYNSLNDEANKVGLPAEYRK